uniref:Ret finger protein-like 4A n=1 Tax=Fundulus heteroclitus TaxID=8078 RepID=A0A3Q2QIZ2_FUNHE
MSSGSNLRSEDQFLCSICLDVFTDPVTTPCGHNFCQTCITQHWEVNFPFKCPLCKELFTSRPQLGKMKKLLDLNRVQQCAVDVTLDPHTANPWLILSDDGKQVHCGNKRKKLPDNPERFSHCINVLGQQSFSSGRFYFEVQVKGKTDWDLGVSRESINRKGDITLSPQDGFWTVGLRNRNEYLASAGPPVCLHVQPGPEKVGVFVDYKEGLVSFYNVNAAALIYSFTGCSFTEKLYPFFSPCLNDGGQNSAPLIICTVNQPDRCSYNSSRLNLLVKNRQSKRR